jgi:hypothetical protein
MFMDSVEDYARQWAKREKKGLDYLSEWVKTVRSIFKGSHIPRYLSLLHDQYVIVSADKASNNIVFVCKSHYVDSLNKELGIDNPLGNPTYTPSIITKEEILDNHRSVLCFLGISTKDEGIDLPSLYWIPKLHKCPDKQVIFAGSAIF